MASSKPTAVHYWLISFVMFTIIGGVVSYMTITDAKTIKADLAAKKKELATLDTSVRSKNKDLQDLKDLIGHNFEMVRDDADPRNQLSVVGKVNTDLGVYGLQNANQNLATALSSQHTKILDLENQLNSANASIENLRKLVESEKVKASDEIKTHKDARTTAESERSDVIRGQEELVKAKEDQINDLLGKLRTVREEFDNYVNQKEEEVTKLNAEITDLVSINNTITKMLNAIRSPQFERADGEVQYVDNNAGEVYLNLGSADYLPVGTNFSIYDKRNSGIGQPSTKADIKGSLEVIRILGPHRAKARVINEDITRPLAKGDLVYTPLWTPGMRLQFSIIGKIDMNDDGVSDRERLRALVSNADAKFDNEVDNDGNVWGIDDDGNRYQKEEPKIGVNTKFFIIGDMPDTSEIDPKDLPAAQKVMQRYTEMEALARKAGVQTISLNDFISFMGFKVERKIYRPGDDRPYNLSAGSRSTATNSELGDRRSSGQVAPLYQRSKRLPAPGANPTNANTFRGGN